MSTFKFALMVSCTIAAGSFASACNDVDETAPEEDHLIEVLKSDGGEFQPPSTRDDTQEVNGAGQCCNWICNNGGWYVNWYVTSGCTGYASSHCSASRGGLWDAWWGSC